MDGRPIGQIAAERVRRYREKLGLTQQDLADRTEELGHPLKRVTIAKIEGGGKEGARAPDRVRADNLTLTEVLVIAAALEVPPVLLIAPLGENQTVAVGGLEIHPQKLVDWLSGTAPLAALPDNRASGLEGFHENGLPLRLFRLSQAQHRRVDTASFQVESAKKTGDAVALENARKTFDIELRGLHDIRCVIVQSGLWIDPLPESWEVRLTELHLAEGVESE